MPPFKIDISKDEIIQLSHNVIQAIQCEWEGCTIILNSWNTLAKHLFQHCSLVVQQGGSYECGYSRCSGRLHASLGALKTHMELSHLSRVALACPARGCKEIFVRVQQFQSHFEHAHRQLINKRVSVEALALLAVLAPPRRLRSPPPLPNNRTWMEFVPVSIPPRMHTQQNVTRSLSRKWSRLNVPDDESDSDPMTFTDLPPFEPHDISEPKVVGVKVERKPPPAKQSLLSRSQPVIYPPIRFNSPEQSILYPRFSRMVDQLVATGALAGHRKGGM